MELSFKEILESESYAKAKAVLFNEIQGIQVPVLVNKKYVAPTSSMPCPSRQMNIDRSVFKKTDEEVSLLLTMKKQTPKSRTHKFRTITHFTV